MSNPPPDWKPRRICLNASPHEPCPFCKFEQWIDLDWQPHDDECPIGMEARGAPDHEEAP